MLTYEQNMESTRDVKIQKGEKTKSGKTGNSLMYFE